MDSGNLIKHLLEMSKFLILIMLVLLLGGILSLLPFTINALKILESRISNKIEFVFGDVEKIFEESIKSLTRKYLVDIKKSLILFLGEFVIYFLLNIVIFLLENSFKKVVFFVLFIIFIFFLLINLFLLCRAYNNLFKILELKIEEYKLYNDSKESYDEEYKKIIE